MADAGSQQRQTHVHLSLTRPILLGEVEREVAILEASVIVGFLFGLGLRLAPLATVAFLAFVVHPLMQRLAKADAQFIRVFIRHTHYRDWYPAGASPDAPPAIVLPFNHDLR